MSRFYLQVEKLELDIEVDKENKDEEAELDIELPKVEVTLSGRNKDEEVWGLFWAKAKKLCKWNISLSILNYLLEVDLNEVVVIVAEVVIGEEEVEDKEEKEAIVVVVEETVDNILYVAA